MSALIRVSMRVAIWVLVIIIFAMPMTADFDEALLLRSCKAGDLHACSGLGLYYEFQRLKESDKTKYPAMFRKAELYDLKACNGGLALGCHQTAYLYMVAQVMGVADHDDLVSAFEQMACDGGDADGCASLAGYESAGVYGAKKNPALALEHLAKAARIRQGECGNGNLHACLSLGYQYETGSGVDQDLHRALPLYQKACAGAERFACQALERVTRELNK